MMGLCLRYSRNREEAEEVMQDGFLLVFKHISKFRGEGNFEGWMRRIMINAALKKHRGKSGQIPLSALTPESFLSADEHDFNSRLNEKYLLRLVQQLPPVYRLVFNLYVLEGLKHKEIASLLNISEGTSKSNLFDARALLRKAIDGKKQNAKTQVYAKTGG